MSSSTDEHRGSPNPGIVDDQPCQQLRLAMTFTGGVSLAVWMGGLAREVNLLVRASASRGRAADEPAKTPEQQLSALYRRLLDLLATDVTVDVLCGTSAGGINAALLGMANARGSDLGPLRDVWLTDGSIEGLLRNPDVANPPSLLQGDGVLLSGLDDALRPGGPLAKGDSTAPPSETTVLVTTTLQRGAETSYTDDFGTVVRDTDHHGLFQFSGADLASDDPTTLRALALAARASASFPGAFEPAMLPIGAGIDAAHPDMGRYANAEVTQFAADGGLLVNFPLEPTLQAIFNRPIDGGYEVRRVLAYVVPTAGAPPVGPTPPTSLAETPGLVPGLLADLTAVRSQTISTALDELRRHNDQVSGARELRRQLAGMAGSGRLVTPGLYRDFRRRLATSLAVPLATELTRVSGDDEGHAARLTALEQATTERIPPSFAAGSAQDLTALGWPALRHAYGTVRATLRSALTLCQPQGPDRKAIVDALQTISSAVSDGPLPPDPRDFAASAGSVPGSLADLADAWVATSLGTAESVGLLAGWTALDDALASTAAPLGRLLAANPVADGAPRAVAPSTVADRRLDAAAYVETVRTYLGAGPAATRLAELYVAERALMSAAPTVEQAVELVQMSSDTRTLLDPDRSTATDKLTGLQLFHFGAFYKTSWRANDWMWGRLDGCGWLVHLLLDPRRLRSLADASGNPAYATALRAALAGLAGEPPADLAAAITAEIAFLSDESAAQPTSLPVTSRWVASALQRHVAAAELPEVARWVTADAADGRLTPAAATFLDAYRAAAAADRDTYPPVPVARVDDVLGSCLVSKETIEADAGTPRFLRTVTKAAAVVGRIVEEPGGKLPGPLAAITSTVSTVTRMAYQAMRVKPLARHAWVAGTAAILVGLVTATSTIGWLSGAGAALAGAGALIAAIAMGKQGWRLAGRVIVLVIGVLLAMAGWMSGPVHQRLFSWLEKTAVPGLEKHPVRWALVVAFVLLPVVVTAWQLVAELRRRGAKAVGASSPGRTGQAPAAIPVQRGPNEPVSSEPGGAASGAPTPGR